MVSPIYLLATSDSVFTLSHKELCFLVLAHQLHEMDCLQSSGCSWVALAMTFRPAFAHHPHLQHTRSLSRYDHTLKLHQISNKLRIIQIVPQWQVYHTSLTCSHAHADHLPANHGGESDAFSQQEHVGKPRHRTRDISKGDR